MPLDDRELAYLWDMENAAKEIVGFMRGVKFVKFEKDKKLRYAVERQLLVIGEAAHHVSPQFRHKHPGVPWQVFIQFRNILAHEYGDSLLTLVYGSPRRKALLH
jgi:uncharacterized protein with HEPN domain